ncbi:Outer membrane protein assembly factor BamA precursor [Rosistilla carotiformis]|uniref:Outer membrane protein assembly factor BamA n=2 Tax=Rosistilla carotiformis TaxID=2528017 RepID=A0A518K012_9BACT|nr:Outer membrane protein assembly factor BamA precursor [Rosistilla carotiformis]
MRQRVNLLRRSLCLVCVLASVSVAHGQFGGGGGMGGGGGNAPAPPGVEKPKFRDHMFQQGSMRVQRETGDQLVASVSVKGNRSVGLNRIMEQVQTREGRVYDFNLVMEDVRRLHKFGAFEQIQPELVEQADGMHVTFVVRERPIVQAIEFVGNRGINDRELNGRVGIAPGDPLNQFSIESARTRLVDYYHEEGFNQATIETVIGKTGYPNAVIYRVNEGPLERIGSIEIVGNTFVSSARLEKIIKSREAFLGFFNFGNRAKMDILQQDLEKLTSYYRDLGFFEAEVGKMMRYDESGKYLTLRFVVKEGPRYYVRNVELIGNQFVDTNSLKQRLRLKPGDAFDRGKLQADVTEIRYGLGSVGFIFADVQPRPTVLDEPGQLDLVYRIAEGDQYKCGEIRIHVDGDDHLVAEHVVENRLEFAPGEMLDRKKLDRSERLLKSTQIFITNPAEGALPRIVVEQPKLVDLEAAADEY